MKRILSDKAVEKQVALMRRKKALALVGPCAGWKQAQHFSTGYDADNIISQVKAATVEAAGDPDAYERDGIIFRDSDLPFHLAAILLKSAVENGNSLRLLDFGGSLGSTYYQCRRLLPASLDIQWMIVEQKRYVEIGRSEFKNPALIFHESIAHASAGNPAVALCSSSLQYVDDYPSIIREILSINSIKYLVIDRTPFTTDDADLVFIQTVPPSIYEAAYPFKIIARSSLLSLINDAGMKLLGDIRQEEFAGLLKPYNAAYRFMVFSR